MPSSPCLAAGDRTAAQSASELEVKGLDVEGAPHLVGWGHGDRVAVHGDQEKVENPARRGWLRRAAALAAGATGRAPADPVRVGGRTAGTAYLRQGGAPAAGDIADDASGWCGIALVEVRVPVEGHRHVVLVQQRLQVPGPTQVAVRVLRALVRVEREVEDGELEPGGVSGQVVLQP